MEVSLIDQGISLMLFGMGTVFVFLTVLVFATTLMSTVVNKLNPEPLETTDTSSATAPSGLSGAPSPQLISAIEKAIAIHRASK